MAERLKPAAKVDEPRVALAIEPETLLLDKLLSNLDANLREEMRFEIRRGSASNLCMPRSTDTLNSRYLTSLSHRANTVICTGAISVRWPRWREATVAERIRFSQLGPVARQYKPAPIIGIRK
jgi:hypothetical protein